jgi:hypothetical protein
MMPAATPSSIYQLLRDCTVRIEVGGQHRGTGFFVAPGLVLTCAHVIDTNPRQLEITWKKQVQPAQLKKITQADSSDLALLEVPFTNHDCVYFQDDTQPFDRLYTYGYPDQYPEGDPATPECEGSTGGAMPLLRLKNAQIRPGMSGAPVLNQRTQRVGGLIQISRGRDNAMGGRALPVSVILQEFPELIELQKRYQQQQSIWGKSIKAITTLYVHTKKDTALKDELHKHLSLLRRQNFMASWSSDEVLAGSNLEEINEHLNTDELILLLISSDFLASDYYYDEVMKRAMERSDAKSAIVVPIILRTCNWEDAPFGKLQALPRHKSVDKYSNQDTAFAEIALGLRDLIKAQTKGTALDKP